LPYLDGPSLEQCKSSRYLHLIRFLWLIPITEAERKYKQAFGVEALEQNFSTSNFDYLDPKRPSVV